MADRPIPRIAVAGFQHETNILAPLCTSYDAFLEGGGWPPLTTGPAVIDVFRGLNIPIGGFVTAAEGEAEIVPILWANAEPANLVTRDAFDRISQMILAGIADAGPLDGVYLDLHGAMVTEDDSDGEGAMLGRLRDRFGADLPVAVSLDLHANISRELVAAADVITIYRSYPHLDMAETGARTWALLKGMLARGERPAKAFRQADTCIPLSAQCTDFGPLKALYDGLERLGPAVLSSDVALCFPLSGTPDARPSAVAYAEDQAMADAAADRLLLALRQAVRMVENPLTDPDAAVRQALALTADGGTVVLADVQDNSGAGAMSDTTGLLRALMAAGADRVVLGALWDPKTAASAHAAGVGARLTLGIGGRWGPEGVSPLPCTATVIALTDGQFVCTGAMQRDVDSDIGPTALLRLDAPNGSISGGVSVVVSSLRHQTIDQALFRHIGVEPAEQRIVAVKSTVHFRAAFAPMAKEVILVEAPGYSPCRRDQSAPILSA